jgi:uncharacterized protein
VSAGTGIQDTFQPLYEFEVFDIHHHVGTAVDSLGWGDSVNAESDEKDSGTAEVNARIRIMNEGGVRQSLVQPTHTYLRPNGITDTRRVNDSIAEYRDRLPGRFPAACGIVQPQDGLLALDEVDRVASELGLAGISFHTLLQGVSVDSPFVIRTLERVGEQGLLPIIHAVNANPHEALWKVGAVARKFPDLTILVVDALIEMGSALESFYVAELAPNLVFDTTFAFDIDIVEAFVDRFGAERVLFGTDLYSAPGLLGRRISPLLPLIVNSPTLSKADKSAILGDNARKLLKL